MAARLYPLPDNETERLKELHRFRVLDSAPEVIFDEAVSLARSLFGVATSVVSLVDDDRQWFKAKNGIDTCETGRADAFCTYAILQDLVMVVPDTHADERFAQNPLVTGAPYIRFYAGAPLTTPNGFNIGTLCIFDTAPRPEGLDPTERRHLVMLAQIVIDRLESRRLEVERRHDNVLAGKIADALTSAAEQLEVRAQSLSDLSQNGALKSDAAAKGVRQLMLLGGEVESSISGISVGISSAAEGAAAVCKMVHGMSTRVDGIAGVATEIAAVASQSHMLALNAAIEAARAGDAGRGFGVVAHEVKQLAARTSGATGHIMNELHSIKAAVDQVSSLCSDLVDRVRTAVTLTRAVENTAELQAATREHVGGEIDETVRSAKGVGDHASDVGQTSSLLLRQAALLRERMQRLAA
jgi:GAF domain-containing protein